MQNKNHWYDGWIYDNLIAPNQDRMFREIRNLIEPSSSVIDVGCGTGRFSFSIAEKVSKVIGVDLSSKNIKTANKMLLKNPNTKILFLHSTLTDLINQKQHYDYAVMTYVIHEVNPEDRVPLLKEMMAIADKIIIGDYLVPVKGGFWSMLNVVVEFLAGKEHYANFKEFIKRGGLRSLSKEIDLKIINEINNKPSTSQILLLTNKTKSE